MRIGILGGTFNPIHNGHLRLAVLARRRLKLDKVIFVPSRKPPHKPGKGILSAKQRYKMVVLAIKGRPYLEVSDYELCSCGISYSVKTLEIFRKKFGLLAELFFLAGADSLRQLKKWKDFNRIVNLVGFIVASRPGYKITKTKGVKIISIPTPNISSTLIRRRLKQGRSVKKFLPKSIHDYIIRKKFYQ